MSRKPILFPRKIEKPNPKLDWITIPFFTNYRLGLPDLVVKDMRCEEYPDGVVVLSTVAKGPTSRYKGQKCSRLVGDDGIVYKAYYNDLFDLVVKENTKHNTKSESEIPEKLPMTFRPIGSYNYSKNSEKVKEYWRDRRNINAAT